MLNFLVTGCWSGFIPVASGSWGSLVALVVWYAIKSFLLNNLFYSEILFILLFTLVATWCIALALKNDTFLNDEDPAAIVLDEWVGLFISLFLLKSDHFLPIITAFITFRLFDATKPWIINSAQALPGAWGIVSDDILAGLAARLVVLGLFFI